MTRPNVVLILADDMGYSDIGCYGGEIATPNLDRLAAGGLRMSQFYNTARCSPSRASLLTGLHPHQTGIGVLTQDQRPVGYAGTLNNRCLTIAEVLGTAGYATFLSGKWHLTGQKDEPNDAWPTRRGFERFFGTLKGSASYWYPETLTHQETNIEHEALDPSFYYTDAISDTAAQFITDQVRERPDQPFFGYVAYTAPHWPLHAPEGDIAGYAGRYDAGWDVLREKRLARLTALGVLEPSWPLSDRDPDVPAWEDVDDRRWQARRMQVYAAQVERMDRGIGRIVSALETAGVLDDTLVVFLSDNGADELSQLSAHHRRARTRDGRHVYFSNSPEVMPGPENTFASYGRGWANLSNTPFREYKRWVHEGGIATPLIAHWPAGKLDAGIIRHQPHQLTDIMPTVLETTGTDYPASYPGRDPLPLEGTSMLPVWRGEPTTDERTLYFEHVGNAAIRHGTWKLVRKYPGDWELYDLSRDRTELHDVATEHPHIVTELTTAYDAWADRCGVIPREHILAHQTR